MGTRFRERKGLHCVLFRCSIDISSYSSVRQSNCREEQRMSFQWFEPRGDTGPKGERLRGGSFGFAFEGPGPRGRHRRRDRGWGPFGGGPGFPFGGPPGGPPPPGWSPFGRGPKVRRGDVRAAALSLIAEQPR